MLSRRQFLLLNGRLGLAGGLAAWLPRTGQAAPVQRVPISVPGPGNLLYMPVTLAGRIGADRAEDLEFEPRYTGGGPQSYRDMLAGNVDFAVAGLSALALQRINGHPVVSILALNSVPAYTLLVRAGLRGKVRKMSDLAGRVLGVKGHVPGGRSTTQLLTEYVLAQAGLSPDSVNFVAVGQAYDSQHAALASGAVDAIMGDEPFATRLVRQKAAWVLADFHDPQTTRKVLGGLFLNAQLCTREDMIARQPELAGKVARTLGRTLVWIGKSRAEDIVAALAPADADERTSLRDALRQHKRMYSPQGRFSEAQLDTVERFLHATEKTPAAQAFRVRSMVDARWAGREA